ILDAVESRLAGEVVGDVAHVDRDNRVDDDVPVLHRVAVTDLDARLHPDADGARDPAAADAFAEAFGEEHATLSYGRVQHFCDTSRKCCTNLYEDPIITHT